MAEEDDEGEEGSALSTFVLSGDERVEVEIANANGEHSWSPAQGVALAAGLGASSSGTTEADIIVLSSVEDEAPESMMGRDAKAPKKQAAAPIKPMKSTTQIRLSTCGDGMQRGR